MIIQSLKVNILGFGVIISTRADKFFFDDFIVTGQAFQDTTPPIINQLTLIQS